MIQWTDRVRQSGKLSIYMGALAGTWGHVFREALHEFNVLCSAHKLGVTMTVTKLPPHDAEGADVSVETADGPLSVSYGEVTKSEDFDGARLHGMTLLFSREPAHTLEKAFIFLPSRPQVNTPKALRPAGAGVMKLIAVHELFHACGLENSSHTKDDLFQGNPRVNAGDTPSGDKILIGVGPKEMPPLYLGGATAKSVKELWSR